MVDNNTELQKQIEEQSKQIKKLTAAAQAAEKRAMLLDKKLARLQHSMRDHTNLLNYFKRKMGGN